MANRARVDWLLILLSPAVSSLQYSLCRLTCDLCSVTDWLTYSVCPLISFGVDYDFSRASLSLSRRLLLLRVFQLPFIITVGKTGCSYFAAVSLSLVSQQRICLPVEPTKSITDTLFLALCWKPAATAAVSLSPSFLLSSLDLSPPNTTDLVSLLYSGSLTHSLGGGKGGGRIKGTTTTITTATLFSSPKATNVIVLKEAAAVAATADDVRSRNWVRRQRRRGRRRSHASERKSDCQFTTLSSYSNNFWKALKRWALKSQGQFKLMRDAKPLRDTSTRPKKTSPKMSWRVLWPFLANQFTRTRAALDKAKHLLLFTFNPASWKPRPLISAMEQFVAIAPLPGYLTGHLEGFYSHT